MRLNPSRLLTLFCSVGVFALATAVLLQQAKQVDYNTDEGQWIATAQYFEFVFLDRTLVGPSWDENYTTLDHPPLTRYILGAAIWLSGSPMPPVNLEHRIEEVRGPDRERYWDPATFANERQLADRRRVERPRPEVLAAARLPMVFFVAGVTMLLFVVGRALSGSLAGLAAGLLLLITPAALTLLPRAHAEAPLLFFTLLGLYFGIRAAGRDEGRRPARLLGVASGLASGLSAASKPTGLLGLMAYGTFAVWAWVVERLWPSWGVAAFRHWCAIAAAAACVTFVAANPFLYPDPVGRTRAMLDFRQQQLFGQRILNASDALPDSPPIRASLLLERTFFGEAPLAQRTRLPLDALLAVGGAAALAWRALRARRSGGLVGPEAFSLAWIATFLVGTAPNLGLDWQRYYLPTITLGLILVGVGLEAILAAVFKWARTGWSRSVPGRRSTEQPAQAAEP